MLEIGILGENEGPDRIEEHQDRPSWKQMFKRPKKIGKNFKRVSQKKFLVSRKYSNLCSSRGGPQTAQLLLAVLEPEVFKPAGAVFIESHTQSPMLLL